MMHGNGIIKPLNKPQFNVEFKNDKFVTQY